MVLLLYQICERNDNQLLNCSLKVKGCPALCLVANETRSAADDHDDSKLFGYDTNHGDDNDWSIGGKQRMRPLSSSPDLRFWPLLSPCVHAGDKNEDDNDDINDDGE